MMKPLVVIHNVETNEIVERPMNDEEYADFEQRMERIKNEKNEQENKAAARKALLDKLGISEQEAQLLLS